MSWMSPNMKMTTQSGGIGGMFSKALAKEKLFQNTCSAEDGPGLIAFASSFPGDIIAVEIKPGQDIICQKSAFLACSAGVDLSIYFQKKLGSGFFGGEGFFNTVITGPGKVCLQTMPAYQVANTLIPYLPNKN